MMKFTENNIAEVYEISFQDLVEIIEAMLHHFKDMKEMESETREDYIEREKNVRSICTLLTKVLGEFKKVEDNNVFIKVCKIEGNIVHHDGT